MLARRLARLVPVVIAVVLCSPAAPSAQEAAGAQTTLTKEEMRQFLLTARVTRSRDLGKGVTRPARLTLTDGTRTQDAVFQKINERRAQMAFARGGGEVNFVDSYLFNLAAWELAEMLGLDHMMPVTVPYQWRGTPGALSWWVDSKMDEGERLKLKLSPPRPEEWNRQMYRMRVFAQLVYDTDRNLGNVLVTDDWKIYMIDFTRAFRLHRQLPSPTDLHRCDRELLARLRGLDEADVRKRMTPYLTRFEIDSLLARRTLIVEHFDELIAARGEAAVLY